MQAIKNLIKRIVGGRAVGWYHRFLAYAAAAIYGHPSEKLIVIGVTGTNGKSTTVNLIAKILESAGNEIALSSTVNFKIGQREWFNDLKMTMPGRFFLQRFLARAVKAGCRYAIIESTSQGILQHRHLGIHYDAMALTNLTPEHIEAHGGFENYRQAKLEYFRMLERMSGKMLAGSANAIPKTIIVNADDAQAPEFLDFQVDQKITFGKNRPADVKAENFQATSAGISFRVNQTDFQLKLKGRFDVSNALAAIAVARSFGIGLDVCKQALEAIPGIPGRMELIDEGQNFKVLVDYAYEPESLKQVFETISSWPKGKIIHVVGSAGGGRDSARRRIMGELSARYADQTIVTNEDPYDDDPQQIIDDVAAGAPKALKILDRTEAIRKALRLAQPNDLVLITGKGAEQKMAVRGGYIPWDDRKVAREFLNKLNL